MEMRVLAHMCGDPGMLKLFRDAKGDIYRDLACSLFNKPTSESVSDAERTQAKTICLGWSWSIDVYVCVYAIVLILDPMNRGSLWNGQRSGGGATEDRCQNRQGDNGVILQTLPPDESVDPQHQSVSVCVECYQITSL